MRRVRIPLFFFSIFLLGFSLWAFNRHVDTGLSILDPEFFKSQESPAERDAQTMAYAQRIRTDAYDRIARGDYENALVRLDQAARHDPRTDWTSPEVQQARGVIEQHLGASATPPSPSSRTTTPAPPSTAPSTSTGRAP
jgi:hypothetical protein